MTNSGGGPMRPGTMRERNLAMLLGEVFAHEPVTRARLAALTGFTKTTVSNLVAVLAEAGLVRDGELVHEGERGRPGVAVAVNRDRAAGLGLEVNVDYLAACVLDLGRRVRYRHLVAADNRDQQPERIVTALARLAEQAVASAAAQGLDVVGASVALPGVFDRADALHAPNLGWSNVPMAGLLGEGLPTLRLAAEHDNEANLAALGELWFGAGRTLGDYLHVSGEIGIGAGIIVGGQVFRGARGFAGELGHVAVAPGGPPCPCGGRGCLERVAGQEAILAAAGLTGVTAGSAAGPRESISALVGLLESGDRRALEAVLAAGRSLGAALAAAVKVLDPDTVVLGGIFSPLAPWVRPEVEAALSAGALYGAVPAVVVSPLAGDAAVLGAAGSVIERVHANPALLLH
ncbi:ROK family transcriptional regulator [Catellatospora sp. KI3]|uniref:ROK family transcriptional regulator n=1 Tax=Catellatospora sp. KI3 TaxID=3041620 RepID=UPI002482C147|nr:ROK family transcriptional regulator [Catellatospora sp. KI3]MDI1461419.1 ROK family transcriptional regulator [Catellatospora sp. KI3]